MRKPTLSLKPVICRRFRAFRQKIGLTQKALAGKMGVPIKSISNIEVEVNIPPVPLILKLMEAYSLSPQWLLSGKGEMFLPGATLEPSQQEYFKKAFPGVPADEELMRMIEKLSIPILRNGIIVKFYELSETYREHIERYEKEKVQERAAPGQSTVPGAGK